LSRPGFDLARSIKSCSECAGTDEFTKMKNGRREVLPIDLGIQARPVAIFMLKNRTLSPAAELFIKCVRAAVKSTLSNLGVPG
jgi:hypothetical protein